jgi:hypothetical protein
MLKSEIPQFLNLFLKRELSTQKESRMWFRHSLLVTDALRKIVMYNRGKVEIEILNIISEIMQIKQIEEYQFAINDMLDMVKRTSISTEAGQIRKILQERWKLKPKPPTYYTAYVFGYSGEILSLPNKIARVYCVSQKLLDEIKLEC